MRVAALATLIAGAALALASWDGLYDALDLPQPLPALLAQIGGVALIGLAWIAWSAARRPELIGTAAVAGLIGHGGGALAIAGWLAFRDPELELGIGDLGTALLAVTGAVFGLLAVTQLAIALHSRPS